MSFGSNALPPSIQDLISLIEAVSKCMI
ncbi:uncharacterized protein METZ01_LOCUS12518 [marine metagenome]|uniref:Uncharacterized protein n=1 Tax=marine metagenome TaxID=408172 RepID=A0A381NZM6_9ZZZZ